MNKADLVDVVSESTGFSKKDTEIVINSTIKAISNALADGKKVQLVGFGVFEVKPRAARVGRNPRTKESIGIPATRQPLFKAGKALKEAVSG